jgi:hypothetical protein
MTIVINKECSATTMRRPPPEDRSASARARHGPAVTQPRTAGTPLPASSCALAAQHGSGVRDLVDDQRRQTREEDGTKIAIARS